MTYDGKGGAHAAIRYLATRGHRRIGYLQGDLRYMSACKRLDGYKRAVLESGLAIDNNLMRGHSWSSADAATDTLYLLRLDDPPTAIFAASDDLAFSAIEVLREQGYRIPADVAVIGFDDTLVARDMRPPLTTVRIPLGEVGRLAADLMLDQIDACTDYQVRSETLPLELVCRGTA